MFKFRKKSDPKTNIPKSLSGKPIIQIPEGGSMIRHALSTTGEVAYNPIADFSHAKADPGGYVVMEGDYGGQVYLTVPMKLVNCGEEALKKLLLEVDSLGWNDPSGASLYYESTKVGQGIPGGMGGGLTEEKLWVHQDLRSKKQAIEDYLAGNSVKIH